MLAMNVSPRKIVRREHTHKLHAHAEFTRNFSTRLQSAWKSIRLRSLNPLRSSSFFKRFTYFILNFSYDLLDVLILFIFSPFYVFQKSLLALSIAVEFKSPAAKWALCTRPPIIEHRLYFARLNWDFHLSGFWARARRSVPLLLFNWIV